MLERAKSEGGDGPKAPEVRVLRAGGRLRVEYDVTNRTPRPHTLVVTVNSEDEARRRSTSPCIPAGTAR